MARGKRNGNKWGGGSFNAVPRAMLRSDECGSLSGNAAKLLLDLLAQYTGNNNGDLCAAWSVMEKRGGWRSSGTLHKAKKELEAKGFIQMTRQGGKNRASLYALTFYSVDVCPDRKTGKSKHDVPDTLRPCDAWRSEKN